MLKFNFLKRILINYQNYLKTLKRGESASQDIILFQKFFFPLLMKESYELEEQLYIRQLMVNQI